MPEFDIGPIIILVLLRARVRSMGHSACLGAAYVALCSEGVLPGQKAFIWLAAYRRAVLSRGARLSALGFRGIKYR